jgi:hypothetical protein
VFPFKAGNLKVAHYRVVCLKFAHQNLRTMKKNYYSAPKGFLIDPFLPLYQTPDVEISSDQIIQGLIKYGQRISSKISSDYKIKQIVTEIKNNTFSFVRSGLLIYKVKTLKLYKKTYSNFKNFCKQALKSSYRQVTRIVEASRVVIELIHAGFEILPRNISQCEHLACYTGNELIEKWEEIIDNIPEHRITATAIDKLLNPPERFEKIETTIKVPPQLYLRILKKALERDMSVVELLEEAFLDDDSLEDPPPEEEQKGADLHLNAWEEDLENLAKEYESDRKKDNKKEDRPKLE